MSKTPPSDALEEHRRAPAGVGVAVVAVDVDLVAGDDRGLVRGEDVVAHQERDVGLGPDAAAVARGAVEGERLRVVLRDQLGAGRQEDQVLGLVVERRPARRLGVGHGQPHEAAAGDRAEHRELERGLGDRDVERRVGVQAAAGQRREGRRVDLEVVVDAPIEPLIARRSIRCATTSAAASASASTIEPLPATSATSVTPASDA